MQNSTPQKFYCIQYTKTQNIVVLFELLKLYQNVKMTSDNIISSGW